MLANLPLSEINRRRLVVDITSSVLNGERISLAFDGYTDPSGGRKLIFTVSELRLLIAGKPRAKDVRSICRAKAVFGGQLEADVQGKMF